MPQRKTKPAARSAEPKQPDPPQPTEREKRLAEAERHLEAIQEAQAFFAGMSHLTLYSLLTFKLISDRNRGCNTPVEEFLTNLVWLYEKCEEEGVGLTIEAIEAAVQGLKDADLSGEIEHAHWMAARYPLLQPEAGDVSNQ